jgi:hypothetical protein
MPDIKLPRPIIKNIAFFGDADVKKTSGIYQDSFELAKLLAQKGYTIVNGGGPGVMDASTKGAEAGGGETISVTFYPKNAPGFEGRYLGNVTDKEVKTKNYIERMFKLMEHADTFIIMKGGTGTVSEFGTAWVLGKLYYGHHKPFILFGRFWKGVINSLKKGLNIDKKELDVFRIATRRGQVPKLINEFQENLARHDHSRCKICAEGSLLS